MEAVPLPGADEVGAGAGARVERRELGLGRDGLEREQRVLRRDHADDLRGVDLFG